MITFGYADMQTDERKYMQADMPMDRLAARQADRQSAISKLIIDLISRHNYLFTPTGEWRLIILKCFPSPFLFVTNLFIG